MKKIRFVPVIITLAALLLLLPLVLFGLKNMWNVHWNDESYAYTLHVPELIFTNAPEGTVYIDPLVRLDAEDECYSVFSRPPQRMVLDRIYDEDDYVWEQLNIDENSEIARYYEDGYISLSLHYKSGGIIFYEDGIARLDFTIWTDDERIDNILSRYGELRAGYVSENGDVLRVTEPAKVVYDDTKPTALLADGGSLTLRISDTPKWQSAILNIIIILELVVFAALIALLIFMMIRAMWTKNNERIGS